MYFPKLSLALVACIAVASAAAGQEIPAAAVQKIAQERPREAEAAARAFIMLVAPDRVEGSRSLDSLKVRSLDQYWMEVAQLTVQFEMVQNLNRRDTVRAQFVARMFGLEAYARELQRAYRFANEAQRAAFRTQLETLIGGHFDIENQLRVLEIKDIERRLAEVRAETQRRIEKRAELVKWSVDGIIRDATRPQ
jgi:hypothetical protein